MNGLEERGRAIGLAAAAKLRARLVAVIRAELRGITAEEEDEAVVIAGRGLVKRWLDTQALRWIAGLLK